jgi:GxxExxY protein
LNQITRRIVDAAHPRLGPGLLESVYQKCLAYEMAKRGLSFREQVHVSILYDHLTLDAALKLDSLVDELVIVELKAVEVMHPVFEAQLLTYLKLAERRVGLLINFNVPLIKDGIKRMVR